MQATNWSLILNVLLLIGVVATISRLMRVRKQSLSSNRYQPPVNQAEKGPYDSSAFSDDIIAVRKVNRDGEATKEPNPDTEQQGRRRDTNKAQPQLMPDGEISVNLETKFKIQPSVEPVEKSKKTAPTSLMMFLLAKENRQFAGYELLQTVLATGLRFGHGQLFHRHQFANGQGPVLCSLAAATATGIFDLQNIGAFSVRGLCLFMEASNNPSIDAERFTIMLETGKQLSEGLDAYLLDDQRKPLTGDSIKRYKTALHITEQDNEKATA